MFPDYNSLKKEWLLYFMEDHYGCWYDGTNCLMGCYFLLFESLKNRIFQGCPGGRMRSLASSLVIAWLTLLGIKAQKIKVWKRAKKTRWPFSSNPGLQATWHQHGAGRDFPQMGQDSNSGAHWDINLSQVKMPLFENQCSQESWMRLFSNCHCSCSCLCQIMVFLMVRSCLLITLIKCLKGHMSLGSLCSVVKTLIVSGNRATNQERDNESYWAVLDS